jgi:hypothetical protein
MRLGLYWHRLQPLSPQPELLQDSNMGEHAVMWTVECKHIAHLHLAVYFALQMPQWLLRFCRLQDTHVDA